MATFNIINDDGDLPQYGPAAMNLIEHSDEDKLFYSEMEILLTDIRSFIMGMYHFFSSNYDSNWTGVRNLIGEVDNTAQTILNELTTQQIRIDDEREATETFSGDYDGHSYSGGFSTYSVLSQSEYDVNQDILDQTRSRLNKLNINSSYSDSVMEGMMNIKQTRDNLQRYKEISSTEDVFALDEIL